MNTRALQLLLKAQPFEPFELVLSSGGRYPIVHPEHCLLEKDCAVVTFRSRDRDRTDQPFALVSYLHIAAAEPLSAASTGNNRKK